MSLDQLLKNRLLPLLMAAVLAFVLAISFAKFFSAVESRVGDYLWRWMADTTEASEQRVVVIDIDDDSIARYGAWPWSRPQLAQLLAALTRQQVALRILDITFPASRAGDDELAGELLKTPTVMAQVLAIDAGQPTDAGQLQGGIRQPDCQRYFPAANASMGNAAALTAAAAGHITPRIDDDGVVRRLPAMICYQGSAYPALALAALAEASGLAPNFLVKQGGSDWLAPSLQLQHPAMPGFSLPLAPNGDVLIPWWLPRDNIISLSARDILEDNVPANLLKGAWVLVGATAFGAGDTVPTPQNSAVAGLEVHLQLLAGLLDQRIPYQPRAATLLQGAWMLMTALILLASSGQRRHMKINMPTLVALILLPLTLAWHAVWLQAAHLWLPWAVNALFIVLSAFLIASKNYWLSRQESVLLYQNLSSYLPEHAAKQIAFQEPVDHICAHREPVVVWYADLRNFSVWCERLPAEQVGAILHGFYTLANQIIQQHGGATEEYVGDAVMAVWRGDAIGLQPLLAAQKLLQAGDEWFGKETHDDQLPPLAIGIGIEQGDVLVGSFGPARRRVHAVLGKTVTTAIRLQAMTAELAQPIIIGQNAARFWQGQADMESLGSFLLQDYLQSTELFALDMRRERVDREELGYAYS